MGRGESPRRRLARTVGASAALLLALLASSEAAVGHVLALECYGAKTTIMGTPEDAVLRGTPRADVILGLAGDDLIVGRGGNDVLCGDAGNDRLEGGLGDDSISGDAGNDEVDGGPGTADEPSTSTLRAPSP